MHNHVIMLYCCGCHHMFYFQLVCFIYTSFAKRNVKILAYLCTLVSTAAASIGQAATLASSDMLLDGQVVNVINTKVPIDDNNYDALISTRADNVNSSAKVCW